MIRRASFYHRKLLQLHDFLQRRDATLPLPPVDGTPVTYLRDHLAAVERAVEDGVLWYRDYIARARNGYAADQRMGSASSP
jgi:hypothetical protein